MVLPQTVMGNYWLTDKDGEKETHLINIEGKNGNWEITSSDYARVITGSWKQTPDDRIKATNPDSEVIKSVILKEYSMYYICIGKSDDMFILYCSPVYETSFTHLNINNAKEILIRERPKQLYFV